MFDTEPYRGYVTLCRELRLERTWEWGDCYVPNGEDTLLLAFTLGNDEEPFDPGRDHGVWLPRLDQWLAMLEEVPSFNGFGVSKVEGGYTASLDQEWGYDEEHGTFMSQDGPTASTPEGACARLWLAVTGRAVTAG